jgi:hypothetical protein
VKKLWALAPFLVAGAVLLWLTLPGPSWVLRAPQPFGAAMLAPSPDGARLLFLLHREEVDQYESRGVGPGPRQVYQLRAYSASTLQPVWTTTLLREEGGHPAPGEMRLLEVAGDRVWVFVREPVLVSLADGAVVPGATGWVAPPKPEAEKPKTWDEYDAIQARQSLAFGSSATRFRIAGGVFGDGWFGVLSEDEAARLASRGVTPVLDDGDFGRSVFVAQRGEGDRFGDPLRIGDSTFLAGGLLREKGSLEPLRATDPDGAFVLHRELAGDAGVWRVARVDLAGDSLWDVELPITEIDQLWQAGDTVLMTGPQQLPADAHPDPHELLIALAARDGAIRSTDLESDPQARRSADAQ